LLNFVPYLQGLAYVISRRYLLRKSIICLSLIISPKAIIRNLSDYANKPFE